MRQFFQLPGYEIIEKLGEGGMSSVWKARQLSLDRFVAIKTLAPDFLADEDALRRFRVEALATARLNHPGIIQVFDAGESNGHPYIVMEYVDGRSLAEILIACGRLPEDEALKIVDAVAHALSYAWDRDCIMHCDVKPDNILISREGAVKVADLGLARFIGLHRSASRDGALIIGTPNYAAPEQAEGVPDLDCRADIYALGATLYHMVTGHLPFAGSAGSSAMDRNVHDFLPDPMDVVPTLSAPTAWLIEKMMIKDRAHRPNFWSIVLMDVAEVRRGRMPLDPLPAPGQSTVARSANRPRVERPDTARARQMKLRLAPEKKRPFAPVGASSGAPAPMRRSRPVESAERASARVALAQTLFLAALAALVYAIFFLGVAERIRLRPKSAQDAPVKSSFAAHTPKDDAEPSHAVDWKVESPAGATPRRTSTAVWRDETFLRGARAFNEAIALFKEYQSTRSDPALLSRAEALARDAVTAFEACRDRAPEGVEINEHIRNAQRLISDVRHSTLVDNARPIAEMMRREESPLAPASSVAPQARTATSAPGLSISPVWNKMPLGHRAIWEDIRKLLSPHGQPAVQLEPAPDLIIIGQITYLMPAAAAARMLGARPGARRSLETPGFPDRSFSYYLLTGDFGEGFDQATLVVDAADRVVAVQLGRESPSPISLDPELFSLDWRVHNIIHGKLKSRRDWRIAHRVQARDGLVIVESEVAEPDPSQVYGLGRSKERVVLYLPQQVVNLVLARLENAN
jgi:serine/threonine-protein kinase